ncbi:thiamine pyrophosphate-binding protein [Anoxybacteroides tepidamans]|uniref:thiamine pyrophosphate-binding protein n=1 Tax=Anoxybacteroides tepidamans TaxID=265948 RepID=UPI000487E587|nr:thiamine pyrophosphate-binding protein [Anoxybacillus tepidamans]
MKKTVAALAVEHFKKFGVQHAFGIPGKAVVPLLLEMEKQEMSFVLTRHESGAGFAAGGYALQKGTLGVAVGTSGPGGTNMLTAAGQAKAFHLPVLFITGHPSMKETGKALGQDSTAFGTDLVKMFEPVTLFSARVERGDLFPMYFRHALEKAWTGRRGPVHLSIPSDVLREEIESFDLDLPDSLSMVSSNIEEVVSLLEQAQSPLLFIGKGAHLSKAYEEIKWLSMRFNIPIITTPGGKGAVCSDHPGYLGPFGLGGTEEASQYLKKGVDLLIVIGTKLTDMTLAGFTPDMYPKQIIQFDCDPTFVGKSIPVPTLAVIGDAKENLRALLYKASEENKLNTSSRSYSISNHKEEMIAEDDQWLSAAQVMKILRKTLPASTIVFGDDGSHTFYAIKYFDILQEGTFFFDDVFGTMGHGIGYAIGAKLANPERPIVCLTGDGCTLMHGTEISTAVCHQIPVVFVVINNGRLDMVDKGMRYNVGRAVGTVYETPVDVHLFAQSLGAASFQCAKEQEIEQAVSFALQHSGPTVIEVLVNPDEIPPTMNRG